MIAETDSLLLGAESEFFIDPGNDNGYSGDTDPDGVAVIGTVRPVSECDSRTGDAPTRAACAQPPVCPDGQVLDRPREQRIDLVDIVNGYTFQLRDWEPYSRGNCVTVSIGVDPALVDPLDVLNALKRHQLPDPVFTLQPSEHGIVNLPTILIAKPGDEQLMLDVGGIPVEVQVATTSYTWNPGDGSPAFTTAEPGRPYPDQTVTHTYTRRADEVTITLTAHWTGSFRIAGTTAPFQPIIGAAQTHDELAIPILEAEAVLVAPDSP